MHQGNKKRKEKERRDILCRVSSAFLWVEDREKPDRSTSDSLWRCWEEEKQQLLLFEEV